MTSLTISSEPQASRQDMAYLRDSVDEWNMLVTGVRDYTPVNIFLRDGDKLRGGILCDLWGGWLHITFLWIDEALRGQGWGSRLLQAAEAEAISKGCREILVETFSWQARPFYEQFGFQVIAELPDYPPGHTHYMLRKTLSQR